MTHRYDKSVYLRLEHNWVSMALSKSIKFRFIKLDSAAASHSNSGKAVTLFGSWSSSSLSVSESSDEDCEKTMLSQCWLFCFLFNSHQVFCVGRRPLISALFHRWMAGSGLYSLISAECKFMRIKSTRASSVKEFRQSVLTDFIKENPLSHSEECTGIVGSRSTRRRKWWSKISESNVNLLPAKLLADVLTTMPKLRKIKLLN